MRLLPVKILSLLFFVPLYFIHMFACWYDKSGNGLKVRKESADYWLEVWEFLRYKETE